MFSSRALLACLSLGLLTGCPKDSAAPQASGEQVVEEAPSRFSGATEQFVSALVTRKVVGWDVSEGGLPVVYDSLTFSEDGAWKADTTVRIPEQDPFTCTESGTWVMDGDLASSATVAEIDFTLNDTDCAGREAPKTWRAEFTLQGQDVRIEDR